MLYILYKTLAAWLLPPGIGILLLLLWGKKLLRRKSPFRGIGTGLLAAGLLLYAASTPLGPLCLLAPLESPYYRCGIPERADSPGVVVLGGGYWAGPEGKALPGPYTTARLARGLEAARQLENPWIICSGTASLASGDRETLPSLGESMGASLRSWGWEGKLLIEDASRNTWENITLLQPLVEKHRIPCLVLVTDAFHMRRSMIMASRIFSCPVYPLPSSFLVDRKELTWQAFLPSMGELYKSWLGLREHLGLWAYALYGMLEQAE